MSFDVLNALGLILNIVGSFMMGYDVLSSKRSNRIRQLEDFVTATMETANETISIVKRTFEGPAGGLYPPEFQTAAVDKEARRRDEALARFAAEIRELRSAHRASTVNFGILGALLLGIGFLVQLVQPVHAILCTYLPTVARICSAA